MSSHPLEKGHERLSFGVFNPEGYVVVAFGTAAAAERARADLLTGGYDAADLLAYAADEVRAAYDGSLGKRGFLSHLGGEREAADRHRALAEDGCAFLVVRAPSDAEAARVVAVARRGDVRLAQQYGRGTVTDLV